MFLVVLPSLELWLSCETDALLFNPQRGLLQGERGTIFSVVGTNSSSLKHSPPFIVKARERPDSKQCIQLMQVKCLFYSSKGSLLISEI